MNAIQPAAHVRAVTGFQDRKAGTRSIAHCAWNRSLLWLLVRFLPVVILSCLSITPVHADGVSGTIGNGQTVNGTITGTGLDTYTFKVTAGSSFVVSVGETGSHNPTFVPQIDLAAPGNGGGSGSAQPLYARLVQDNAAEGTWTVKVSRADQGGTTGGTYALTLVQMPGAMTAGQAAVAMSPGAVYSGSNSRGNIAVWTFKGVAGHTATLTINQTGGAGFAPEISVYTPTNGLALGFTCSTSCDEDVSVATSGVYTVMARKSDNNDVTGTYTLSVNDKN